MQEADCRRGRGTRGAGQACITHPREVERERQTDREGGEPVYEVALMRVYPEIRPRNHKRGDLHFAQWVCIAKPRLWAGFAFRDGLRRKLNRLKIGGLRGAKSDARLAHWAQLMDRARR